VYRLTRGRFVVPPPLLNTRRILRGGCNREREREEKEICEVDVHVNLKVGWFDFMHA
jgi:hypothetical protein